MEVSFAAPGDLSAPSRPPPRRNPRHEMDQIPLLPRRRPRPQLHVDEGRAHQGAAQDGRGHLAGDPLGLGGGDDRLARAMEQEHGHLHAAQVPARRDQAHPAAVALDHGEELRRELVDAAVEDDGHGGLARRAQPLGADAGGGAVFPQPEADGVARGGRVFGREEAVDAPVNQHERAIAVRLEVGEAAVRPLDLIGGKEPRDPRQIVVRADGHHEADARGIARIRRRQEREPAREAHPHHPRAPADALVERRRRGADGVDGLGVDAVVGDFLDLGREHHDAGRREGAGEAHQARLLDAEPVTPCTITTCPGAPETPRGR